MVKVEKGISVNTSTGEVYDVYIEKEVSSQNFWKIWLGDILTVLGIISNSKQLDVVLYIMENIRPSDNLFVGSYDKMADKLILLLSDDDEREKIRKNAKNIVFELSEERIPFA